MRGVVNRTWGLDDQKGFGQQYRDKEIWWIIDNDPEHIRWLIQNVKWFELDNEAWEAYQKAIRY